MKHLYRLSLTLPLMWSLSACELRPFANAEQPDWVVVITPATATLVTLGEVVQLTASLRANGNTNTSRTFTWTSSNGGIARVNASGLVTAVANGSTSIRASTFTPCLSFSGCPRVSRWATITVSIR